MADTIEVPFKTSPDGRRFLTKQQTVEHPYLADFVKAFPACFEWDGWDAVYWYLEPK